MTIGIMQPYFFPYIGYWQLINAVDEWVFFDVVQYNKKSWMNRNRILHPDASQEWQYINIPIKKHEKGTLIRDIQINNSEKWKEKIFGQLTVYKKLKAPYYVDTINLIHSILDKEYDSFLSLCVESTEIICTYLGIELKYKIASDIEFDRSEITGPGDWALAIAKAQKADRYINPFGGYEIFDDEKYKSNGIELSFLKSGLSAYRQSRRKDFVSGLSIIDVLMFNDKIVCIDILKHDYRLCGKYELESQHNAINRVVTRRARIHRIEKAVKNEESISRVEKYLLKVDNLFPGKLRSAVDIPAYGKKIALLSDIFFVVVDNSDVAMVSVYLNDSLGGTAYISSLSVLQEYQKLGFAKELLAVAEKEAKLKNMKKIKLQVHKNNDRAMSLYRDNAFAVASECDGESYLMEKHL